MFTYSFAKGARLGYLAPKYRALATRAFDGMLHRVRVRSSDDGLVSISGICKVAGLGGNPPRDGTYEYYVSEPVVSDDYKGVGAFMLAAHRARSMSVLDAFSLAGQTALVTGASRGLGRAMAIALAEAGADVACASARA